MKREDGNAAELVARIRGTTGLTQEQFAAQFGVTVATGNRWENGRAIPHPLATKELRDWAKRYALE